MDALGNLGDKRIIKPALQNLDAFRSPAIRLQLLNSVCRSLGAEDQFYRLLSLEDTRRSSEINRMLTRAASRLSKSHNIDVNARHQLQRPCERLVQSYEDENTEWLLESVKQIVGIVRDGLSAEGQPAYEVLSVYVVILAINAFLQNQAGDEMEIPREIFLTVCLTRLSDRVKEIEST